MKNCKKKYFCIGTLNGQNTFLLLVKTYLLKKKHLGMEWNGRNVKWATIFNNLNYILRERAAVKEREERRRGGEGAREQQ